MSDKIRLCLARFSSVTVRKRSLMVLSVVVIMALMMIRSQVHAQPTSCPGTPSTRLLIGMRAHVTPVPVEQYLSPLRVRQMPSKQGVEVMQLGLNDQFLVVAGPACADGYLWWQINVDNGVNGWVAEGTTASYFVEPLNNGITSTPTETLTPTVAIVQTKCGNAPPTALAVGIAAIVRPAAQGRTPNSIRLRDKAGTTGKFIGNLPEGVVFNVISGPTCADGYLWWQISAENGVKGWVAEGDSTKYYIVPVSRLTPSPIPPSRSPTPPIVTSFDCPGAPHTRFTSGMFGVVIRDSGVRVHIQPDINSRLDQENYVNSPTLEFDGLLPANSRFWVDRVEVCNQGYVWLAVSGVGQPGEPHFLGYLAENDGLVYSVEPVTAYVTATPILTATPLTTATPTP
ncbi:MAG: SH3 domain-containing protein [Chloroflexota bacterium]